MSDHLMIIARTDRFGACMSLTPDFYPEEWGPGDVREIAAVALEEPERIPGLCKAQFLAQDARLVNGEWQL